MSRWPGQESMAGCLVSFLAIKGALVAEPTLCNELEGDK
jgi:hypothetical protein